MTTCCAAPIHERDLTLLQRYVLGEIVLQDMSIRLSEAVWRDLTSSFFQWEGAAAVRELVRKRETRMLSVCAVEGGRPASCREDSKWYEIMGREPERRRRSTRNCFLSPRKIRRRMSGPRFCYVFPRGTDIRTFAFNLMATPRPMCLHLWQPTADPSPRRRWCTSTWRSLLRTSRALTHALMTTQ